jgi:anti-anti-sigma regulatory factor
MFEPVYGHDRKKTCLIEPTGIIDAKEGQAILERIQYALSENCETLLIALSAVELIDEHGMELLRQGLKKITESGAEVAIFPLDAKVRLSLGALEKIV